MLAELNIARFDFTLINTKHPPFTLTVSKGAILFQQESRVQTK